MSWEEDEFRFIRLKSFHVSLESFSIGILSSVVDSDTNSSGELGSEASFLQFSVSKSFSVSELGIIFDSASSNNRSQRISWEMTSCLSFSR